MPIRKGMQRWAVHLWAWAVVLLVTGSSAWAEADLSEVLGTIKWGDSRDDVLAKLKSEGMESIRKDPKFKSDKLLLQEQRKRLLRRLEEAEKSHIRLNGDDTGYEISVIADEFSANNGEAVLRVKDQVAQRFYFFVDNDFYKLVVAYNPTYLRNVGFESFVGSSVGKYGRPTTAEYDTIRGEEQLALVRWENPATMLMVKNKKELFDTYTMSFADRNTLKKMAASGKRLGGSDKEDDEVDASVAALMEGGDTSASADVLDSIVGSTEVNLNAGRPKDDQVRRYTGDGETGAVAEAKVDSTKKKKKKKKKKRKVKKAPNFKNLKAKTGDDLIIY